MVQKGLKVESPISRGIRAFLVFCRMEKGLSLNSLDAYARDLAGFQAFTEQRTGGEYPQAEDLVLYLNALYKKDLSSRTIARHLSAVRNLFHFLLSEGLIAVDPTEHR